MYRKETTLSRIDQRWGELKEKLLSQFKELTEEDLQFETGRKHEMIDRIRTKLGKTDEEMNAILQIV